MAVGCGFGLSIRSDLDMVMFLDRGNKQVYWNSS